MRIYVENILWMLVFGLLMFWSMGYVFGLVTWPVIPPVLALLNAPSIGLVIGGLMIATLISYPASQVRRAMGVVFSVFSQSPYSSKRLSEDISMIIEWLRLFRTNRTEAFVKLRQQHRNNFEAYLISLLNTNYDPEEIRRLGGKQIHTAHEMRLKTSRVLQSMGNAAPAFGMLGTLFGLIVILDSFQDAAQLGRGLSLALMTTLYGLVLAHFVFFPLALKVRTLADEQRARESMVLEGVVMVRQDRPPMIIRDELNTWLERDFVSDE